MVLVVLLIVLVDVSSSRAADTYYDIDAQFIGCYRWGIQESWDYTRSGGMTIDLCTETCRRYMKTYAALQNGSVCRCSNDVIRHHPVDECHVTCSGHPQQYCGGLNGSMSVFASCPIGFYGESCSLDCNCLNRTQCNIRTGDCPNGCDPDWSGSKCDRSTADFSISPTYMGCWKDSNPRDFESENYHFQATVETCSVFCRRKKYTYMGLQFFSECFCGNSFGQYGQRPEAECNQPCHQNKSQMCGGGSRNSVYSVCPIGFFGDACTQACHCTKGVRCFVANGTCISGGCAQGWNGQACNIKDHSCSKGAACKPDETCKMYDLKFTQVSRCECRGGFVRPGTWSTCIGLDECRKRKDCNSMLNIDSTGIDDDPGTFPLAQPLTENADYDAGSRISVLIAFLVISLIANVALIAFLIFRTRLDTVWNPYARHLGDGDSNSM